jgi:hypothetical protein
MEDAYRNEFWRSMQSQQLPPPPKPKKSLPKWLIPAIIGVVLVVVIVIVVVVVLGSISNVNDGGNLGDDAFEADRNAMEEANSIVDNLNPAYAEEAKKDSHADYKSENDFTTMIGLTPIDICLVLNADCSELGDPSKMESLEEITALNSSSMSYYLDQGHVLVIYGYGEYPFSLVGQSVVVFAVNYMYGVKFSAFTANKDGTVSSVSEFGRDMLVNKIVGIPKFYISKEVFTSGD